MEYNPSPPPPYWHVSVKYEISFKYFFPKSYEMTGTWSYLARIFEEYVFAKLPLI